jgi:hypothetical protein
MRITHITHTTHITYITHIAHFTHFSQGLEGRRSLRLLTRAGQGKLRSFRGKIVTDPSSLLQLLNIRISRNHTLLTSINRRRRSSIHYSFQSLFTGHQTRRYTSPLRSKGSFSWSSRQRLPQILLIASMSKAIPLPRFSDGDQPSHLRIRQSKVHVPDKQG